MHDMMFLLFVIGHLLRPPCQTHRYIDFRISCNCINVKT